MEKLIRRFVIFLIRHRFGVRAYKPFRFIGQKSDAVYYFTKDNVQKTEIVRGKVHTRPSSVSLNWLLNPECKIEEVSQNENIAVHC